MQLRAVFEAVTTVILTACAVVLVVVAVRKPDPSKALEPKRVRDWEQYAELGSPIGSADGLVTVVEFSER